MSLLPRIAYAVTAAGTHAVRTRTARAWRRVRALPARRPAAWTPWRVGRWRRVPMVSGW